MQLPMSNGKNVALLMAYLHALKENNNSEHTSETLSHVFAPVLCRTLGSAYMSLGHQARLPACQNVITTMIEHYEPVFEVKSCMGLMNVVLTAS